MNISKRIVSCLLGVVLVMTLFLPIVSAKEDAYGDIYADNYTEYVFVGDARYQITYTYNGRGNKETIIINETTLEKETLEYKEDLGTFYLNGCPIGWVTFSENNLETGKRPEPTRDWVYEGYYHDYISWIQGITVAALAVMIGACIGGATASAVISRVGAGVLGAVAAAAIGMDIYYYLYSMDLGDGMSLWYKWEFIPSTNEVYGWYNTYFTYSYYD